MCTYFVLNIIVTQFQTIWNDKSIGLRLKLMIHNTQEINFFFYKMTDVWKHQTAVIKVTTNRYIISYLVQWCTEDIVSWKKEITNGFLLNYANQKIAQNKDGVCDFYVLGWLWNSCYLIYVFGGIIFVLCITFANTSFFMKN